MKTAVFKDQTLSVYENTSKTPQLIVEDELYCSVKVNSRIHSRECPFNFQVVSVEELCSAYRFLAQFHLNKNNLEEAEKYAHKCCEHHEVPYCNVCAASWCCNDNNLCREKHFSKKE